ncbi:DUF4123 domain-containing protein [Enterovibrio coralii]|uniref:DUF4123 domain-containing protein n=1 Tax=Enterovibrio coralii TaxID=294935 RepID=A0A135IC11_9GAMM|nr:DUF4123 domain-containing protein [Enterovibrio coralii]KXF83007.1 hypothetical protein ATN88_04495 [Enterovibrio coralii]
MAKQVNEFAIIDGANEEELLSMLAELDPPHTCLYLEPVQPELVNLAPYLVQLTDEVKEWLSLRTSLWGIYITSTQDLQSVRRHLRKFLQVQLPNEEKPVFFRFYDPRNVWDLTDVLTDWELHNFLGPIEDVATVMDGQPRSDNFQQRREAFPKDTSSKSKMMRFNAVHMDKFSAIFEARYIAKLHTLFPGIAANNDLFLGELFRYVKAFGITDDRSVRGIARLCEERGLSDLDSFKRNYAGAIQDESEVGHYRAEALLIRELGYVPA